ncbi:MAG: protein translocase subunit SecF [Clostridia bacterium]|nr:protein translocase subunit SecF [Clostridia bacterium]
MTKYNFMKKKTVAFIITAVILVAGLASFFIGGFNMGVDFTGGSKITMQMEKTPAKADIDTIETLVKDVVGADNFVSIVHSTSNNKTVIVTVKSMTSFDAQIIDAIAALYGITADQVGDKTATSDEDEEYAYFTFESDKDLGEEAVKDAINAVDADSFKSVSVKDGKVTINYYSTSYEQKIIDAINADEALEIANEDISTISKNRASAQTKTALIAAAVAIVLMLVYITFRFKQIESGLSSVLCLFFNLFVMFAFYSILRWELTLDIIPACLTILGYSINATIVIFDRIRENLKKETDFEAASNSGVHSTLLRSINTTITTLITIVLVYILGVESIKAFALPLIIGILAGLFSSVFLSAPIWAVLRKWFKTEERAAAKAQKLEDKAK